MKNLVLLFLLAGMASLPADDDILQNGDFSSGLAHWFGNLVVPGDAPLDSALPGTGVVMEMRAHDWTKFTQDFELKPGTYQLHVAFTLSPDIHLSNDILDYVNLPTRLDFPDIHPVDAFPGQWLVAVSDPTEGKSLCWRVTRTHKTGFQSYTFTVRDINFQNRQTLIIAFPPGTGWASFDHVTLVPADASAPASGSTH